jgi:hypothetical protein
VPARQIGTITSKNITKRQGKCSDQQETCTADEKHQTGKNLNLNLHISK